MRLALLLAAGLLLWAAPAHAELSRLDASGYPELQVTLVTERPTAKAPPLFENGSSVDVDARNLSREKSVVLAVDRSRSMAGESLEHAIAAARAFVAAKPRGDRLAVIGFGSQAVLLSAFSSATIDADIALRTLGVDAVQGTALNDAVRLAALRLAREPEGARVLVVVTDGNDVSSAAGEAEAIAAAREAGVTVYAIGIEGPQFSPDVLRRLATETGGTYHAAAGAAALSNAYAGVANDLRRTWRLSWLTTARPGERLELKAGSFSLAAELPGRSEKSPAPIGPEQAYTSPGGALVIGLAVGFLVLMAFAAAAGARRGSWLRRRLAPHLEHRPAAGARNRKDRLSAGSPLLRLTERALGELRLWRKVNRILERADMPLRTAEFFWICFGSGLLLAFVTAVAGRPTVFSLGGFALGGALPLGFVTFRARRRLRAFDNQLPDLLLTLAASMKAGHSFKQGIQTVVDEGLPPASEELRRVLAEVSLGRPLEEALREMSNRVGSDNLEFVVTAVTIQGQVGGSLAGLFDMVAEAVRQRQQFARKIRGLTAMGRASAYVLAGIPFFLAGVLTLLNTEYMAPLWHTSAGHTIIVVGLTMMAIGSVLLRRIVSFKG
ncbi:MAG: type II secretion system F family protein [Gaiellaceae bacterium]